MEVAPVGASHLSPEDIESGRHWSAKVLLMSGVNARWASLRLFLFGCSCVIADLMYCWDTSLRCEQAGRIPQDLSKGGYVWLKPCPCSTTCTQGAAQRQPARVPAPRQEAVVPAGPPRQERADRHWRRLVDILFPCREPLCHAMLKLCPLTLPQGWSQHIPHWHRERGCLYSQTSARKLPHASIAVAVSARAFMCLSRPPFILWTHSNSFPQGPLRRRPPRARPSRAARNGRARVPRSDGRRPVALPHLVSSLTSACHHAAPGCPCCPKFVNTTADHIV